MQNNHGGPRSGAGRKKGSSVYGESTRAIRVPESLMPTVRQLLDHRKQHPSLEKTMTDSFLHPAQNPNTLACPLFTGKVAAGFPSPADDHIEKTLDLNELLISKPTATFFVRAEGESMLGAGIHPNDILVVDRSLEAVPGKIVICAVNSELTVKRLIQRHEQLILASENSDYPDILIREDFDLVIWGVVTNVIHAL